MFFKWFLEHLWSTTVQSAKNTEQLSMWQSLNSVCTTLRSFLLLESPQMENFILCFSCSQVSENYVLFHWGQLQCQSCLSVPIVSGSIPDSVHGFLICCKPSHPALLRATVWSGKTCTFTRGSKNVLTALFPTFSSWALLMDRLCFSQLIDNTSLCFGSFRCVQMSSEELTWAEMCYMFASLLQ